MTNLTITGAYFSFTDPQTETSTPSFVARDLNKEKDFFLQAEMFEKSISWWEEQVMIVWNAIDNITGYISNEQMATYANQLDYLFAKANVEEKNIDNFNKRLSGYIVSCGLNKHSYD